MIPHAVIVDADLGNSQICLPQHSAIWPRAVRVEGIHRIIFRRRKNHIVRLSIDDHIRNVNRLGVHVAIERIREELAEIVHVDVRRRKNEFIRVLALARVVVVICQSG